MGYHNASTSQARMVETARQTKTPRRIPYQTPVQLTSWIHNLPAIPNLCTLLRQIENSSATLQLRHSIFAKRLKWCVHQLRPPPLVTNASVAENRHKGRKTVVRCALHQGLQRAGSSRLNFQWQWQIRAGSGPSLHWQTVNLGLLAAAIGPPSDGKNFSQLQRRTLFDISRRRNKCDKAQQALNSRQTF
jgi:hypothetical protein